MACTSVRRRSEWSRMTDYHVPNLIDKGVKPLARFPDLVPGTDPHLAGQVPFALGHGDEFFFHLIDRIDHHQNHHISGNGGHEKHQHQNHPHGPEDIGADSLMDGLEGHLNFQPRDRLALGVMDGGHIAQSGAIVAAEDFHLRRLLNEGLLQLVFQVVHLGVGVGIEFLVIQNMPRRDQR